MRRSRQPCCRPLRRGAWDILFDSPPAFTTFGAGQINETVLEGQGYFIAKHVDRTNQDSDVDRVPDVVDFCPATRLPEIVPTRGRLLPNRFAITDEGPAFSANARGAGKVGFTIVDTKGCSCEQIIDYLGLGQGHRKHGCSLGVMRAFIKRLPEQPPAR